jgi:protein-tyrosine-phosphatase
MRSDVVHRAALHAALADPARLAIIDTLTLSDASPSELGTALSMPSNLLAHHLRVLETEGLITRSRSEGDRRRTYLSLVPGALDQLVPGRTHTVTRIVFVCSANSARSQLASALWRRTSTIPATSGGLHPAAKVDPGAVAVAARHHLPLRRHNPRHLDEVLSDGDFIITVCDHAHEELDRRPDLHWSIPDPVKTGQDAAFEAAYDELARRITDLAPRLTRTQAAS